MVLPSRSVDSQTNLKNIICEAGSETIMCGYGGCWKSRQKVPAGNTLLE